MVSHIVFTYLDGEVIHEGDRILVDANRMASVRHVLQPGTPDAKFWQCPDTGGVLIDFDDGDCWLCRDGFDEDFQKV